jgi:hypothetical protein
MNLATDRYELLVAFSSRIDDWGLVTDPDDYDERSHDMLVSEYITKLVRGGFLSRTETFSDSELLIGYAHWLDNNGVLRSAGPGEDGLERTVERFLKERSK